MIMFEVYIFKCHIIFFSFVFFLDIWKFEIHSNKRYSPEVTSTLVPWGKARCAQADRCTTLRDKVHLLILYRSWAVKQKRNDHY